MVFFAFKAVFSSLFNLKYAISCLSLCFLFLFSSWTVARTDPSIGMCNVKEKKYNLFWPQNMLCNCFRPEGEITADNLKKCEEAAQTQLEAQCNLDCSNYINVTINGCPKFKGVFLGRCAEACQDQDLLEAISDTGFGGEHFIRESETRAVFQKIEYTLNENNDRYKCVVKSKQRYVERYETICKKKIKEISARHNRTLLCKKDATKTDTGCDQYCNKRGNTHHGSELKPDEIANIYSINSITEMRYLALAATNEVLDPKIMKNVEQFISGNGVITQAAQQEGVHWLCKKGAGMACESRLNEALNNAVKSCADLQTQAQECCHNPEQCAGGGLANAFGSLGKMHVGLSTLKGRKEFCQAVEQAHGMYGGMQGAMAAQCQNRANTCTRECNQYVDAVLQAFKTACNYNPHSKGIYNVNKHSCDQDLFKYYMAIYNGKNEKQIKIANVPKECQSTGRESNRRIQDMNTNLATSLLASVDECGQESKDWESSENPELPDPSGTTPQGPAGPGIQIPNVPVPNVNLGGGGDSKDKKKTSALPFPENPSVQEAANPFETEPELGEGEPVEGKGTGRMGGLLGGSGSGGGGFGLGGGGGSPGKRNNRGGSPSEKKKKILFGYKGGKFAGYSGGSGSSSAGGGSRGRSSRSITSSKRKTLDLDKLFPKGKQLNHKIGKYGSPHDDIFKRMSDRIQWMCRTNKLNCQ